MNVQTLESAVCSVLSRLPDKVGRERFLGAFLSLKTAELLNYKQDLFRARGAKRHDLVEVVVRCNPLERNTWGEAETEWIASFYFNNALIRIAVTAEVGLKALYSRHFRASSAPDDYEWLADWYKETFNGGTGYLRRARQEINAFKHGRKNTDRRDRKLEQMHEGVAAFRELLALMERIADVQPGAPADGPRPAGSARS